jgi:8-oxo-dGTP diphosphatase
MDYVAGFAVCRETNEVALIRKSHPEWQAGKLNGVGGKIKVGSEMPAAAMVREFQEETGQRLVGWRKVVKLSGSDYRVHFFVVFVDSATLAALEGSDDEPIEVKNIDDALSLDSLIPNLKWIIPLCLDKNNAYAEVYE